MCTRNCLCNTCHKRNKCSDCPYIDMRDTSNNTWSIVCSTTGIQSCDYYIKPPETNYDIEEDKPIVEYKEINGNKYVSEDGWETCQLIFESTIIKFKNGSTIETASGCENTIRSRPRIYQLVDLSEYHWWQRLYLRFLDSDLVKKIYRNKRI